MSTYKTIDKSLGYRVNELGQSVQVIKDSVDAVRAGNLHQLIPLYGQLRSLIAEKSKNNKPLLLDIAEKVGHPLEFYCMPGVDKEIPAQLRKGLILHLSGFPLSIKKEFPKQQLVNIKDFIGKNILEYNNKKYTAKDLITFFANKAGGSHYSTNLPQDFSELLSHKLFGQQVLTNALLQIGVIVLMLSLKLLKKIADLEIHLLIFVPQQKIEKRAFIFDYKYPKSNMRSFAYLDSLKKVHFGITSINGFTAIASSEQLNDWSEPYHLNFRLYIESNLKSSIEIIMNGEMIGKQIVNQPLIIASDTLHYDGYFNRSYESEDDSMNIAVSEIVMYGTQHNLTEQAQLIIHFKEALSQEKIECIYFNKGSFGLQPSGETNMKMNGRVVKWDIKKLINNKFPNKKL